MTGIDSYSTTAATNATADAGAINWAEGQAPSTVNNTARQWMADTRARHNDLIWFQYGTGDQGAGNVAVPAVYASATSFTIAGANVTAVYHVGRRVRAVGSGTGTIFGRISVTSYAPTTTTVTVVWDSGSLSNETLVISLAQVPVTGKPVSVYSIAPGGIGVAALGALDPGWGSPFNSVAQFANGALASGGAGNFNMIANAYWNNTDYVRVVASTASLYQQDSGGHLWAGAGSSTAGSTISFTNLMGVTVAGVVRMYQYGAGTATFDSSGNISSVSDPSQKIITGAYKDGLSEVVAAASAEFMGWHKWRPESGMETEGTYASFFARDTFPIAGAVSKNASGVNSFNDRPVLMAALNAIAELEKLVKDLEARLEVANL